MHPFAVLLIAVAIVLVGILVLRLHAFVALLLAAITVSVLTPATQLETYAQVQVTKGDWTEKQADKFLHQQTIGKRVSTGFGNTCASVGILIAMASIIGKCLLDSGAAERIVRAAVKVVGEARAGIAFIGSGFVLGIPVFFDTVFYLMIPLGKAMRLRTGKNYVLYILTIMAGGTMAHSLVPPTPGPLIVVEQFDKLGLIEMIIGGTIVGLFASSVGYFFAKFLNRRIVIPLRPSEDQPLEELEAIAQQPTSELPPLWMSLAPILLPVVLIAAGTAQSTYFKSISLSIKDAAKEKNEQIAEAVAAEDTELIEKLGPVVTEEQISADIAAATPAWKESAGPLISTFGDKNVALLTAAAIALFMLVVQTKTDRTKLAAGMQSALGSAGVIILITASGGAFGNAVRQCGIADEISKLTEGVQPIMLLPIAFGVTTLIRSAQGSATVAMITAAGVLSGIANSDNLAFHPVYLALAIGCGSKPIAWMADSGFWVMCKLSGMTEGEALRTITPMSIVMGIAGLIATIIGALVLPFSS